MCECVWVCDVFFTSYMRFNETDLNLSVKRVTQTSSVHEEKSHFHLEVFFFFFFFSLFVFNSQDDAKYLHFTEV